MTEINFSSYNFKFKDTEKGRYIFDPIRKKFVFFTPEEEVRQHILHYLIFQMNYPQGLISVEREIRVNQLKKRYDIVVYDRNKNPWLLVECKEPNVKITDKTLNQLLRYHRVLQCPYWLLTNGHEHFCGHLQKDSFEWLGRLPVFND